MENSIEAPCVHKGYRTVDQANEVYTSVCERCGKKESYQFPAVIQEKTDRLVCARHKALVVQDFLGMHCIYCEIENSTK